MCNLKKINYTPNCTIVHKCNTNSVVGRVRMENVEKMTYKQVANMHNKYHGDYRERVEIALLQTN